MLTLDIYDRVFHIHANGQTGTAFAIEVDRRQYLISAARLIHNRASVGYIEFEYSRCFRRFEYELVGFGPDDADVVVMALDQKIAHAHPHTFSRGGLCHGQDVFFLGFSYKMRTNQEQLRSNFPLAFIKKALLSGSDDGRDGAMYLDGYNNEGFSGGPVIFRDVRTREHKICAVVSGFRTEDIKALEGEQENDTDLIIRINAGIMRAYPIEVAIDICKANPIGFAI